MNFLIFTPLHKSLGSESESRSYERYSLRSNSNRQREIRKSLEKTNRDERETLVYSNADRQIHSTVELRETAIPRIFCCFDFHYSRLTRQREVIFHRAKFRNKQERKGGRGKKREKFERNPVSIIPLYRKFDKISLSNGSVFQWMIGESISNVCNPGENKLAEEWNMKDRSAYYGWHSILRYRA